MTQISRWQRGTAYAAMILCAVAAALYLGQDMNWDLLNYHLYAGYSALEGRLGVDYFAASTQSYLNPYSHVPLYLMISHGLAPQLVVAALALMHAAVLLLVYEMAIVLNRRPGGEVAWFAVALAVVLAFLNPVFLLELGNTFNEITTGTLVMAGWYLLMRQFRDLRLLPVALAGALIGVAIALKLSNMLFSVTALPLLLMAPRPWVSRLQAVAMFAVGGLAGAAIAGGWWAWQLWELFGNPFFPMFNHIFQAPEMTSAALKHYRFLPASLGEFLWKPFQMAVPKSAYHSESAMPDLRYAALVLLFLFGALKLACSRAASARWPANDPFPPFQGQRLFAALAMALCLAWVAWLASSGNSRYFLPMGSIAAVLLASLIVRLSPRRYMLVYGALSLAALQLVSVLFAAELRWDPVAWGNAFFEVEVPAPLRGQAYLHWHTSAQSASYLLPFLAPGSSMINPSGAWTLGDNPAIRALLRKYDGRVRAMQYIFPDTPPSSASFPGLVRFGLEADRGSCLTIRTRMRGHPLGPAYKTYLSCAVRPLDWTAQQRAAFSSRLQKVDMLFDQLELACPSRFQPRGLLTETDGKTFWRIYSNTDRSLHVRPSGKVSFRNEFNYTDVHVIGTLDSLGQSLGNTAAWCR